jgi:xanthine dehydrogenase accessory factor
MMVDARVVVRGGGDLATGVIYRLHRAGFAVTVLELAQPRALRRAVSAAQAVYSGRHEVEGILFEKVATASRNAWHAQTVPVVVDPGEDSLAQLQPDVLVDARLLKRGIDCTRDLAPLVIGLGPGFCVGGNCHVVVETQRGHTLGRVFWSTGETALEDTGVPETVAGHGGERVLRAPCAGERQGRAEIGDHLPAGTDAAGVDGRPGCAPFAGVLRGLMHSGLTVAANEKIGDIDPRSVRENCFRISDKALAIGGGVLEAILRQMHQPVRAAL